MKKKQFKLVEEEEIISDVVYYHIYDFLNRCKINRAQHEVLFKKFECFGLKTKEEWEKITNVKMI